MRRKRKLFSVGKAMMRENRWTHLRYTPAYRLPANGFAGAESTGRRSISVDEAAATVVAFAAVTK